MLFHRGPVIKLNIQQVQQQDNSVDCGVFAVAYATSILHGQNPEDLNYDTCSLRQHLLTCISSGIFKPFPLSNLPHSKSKKKTLKLKLFCSCRMPWDAADEEIPESKWHSVILVKSGITVHVKRFLNLFIVQAAFGNAHIAQQHKQVLIFKESA